MAKVTRMTRKKPGTTASNFFTDARLKRQFDGFVGTLDYPGKADEDPRAPYMYEVTEVLWLFFMRMGKDAAERFLAAELPRVAAFKKGARPTPTPTPVDPQPTIERWTEPPKVRKPKAQ